VAHGSAIPRITIEPHHRQPRPSPATGELRRRQFIDGGEHCLQGAQPARVPARQEDLIMGSKKWFSLVAAAAIFTGACASNAPSGSSGTEQTATAESPVVAPLACTPMLTTAPFLSCGAASTAQLSLATSFQSQIITQMQAALANLTLTTNLSAQQVIISSQASQFATLFGTQIIAPLTATGLFTVQVPLLLGGISPDLNLVVNVFGAIPWLTPFPTGAPFISPALLTTPTLSTSTTLAASSAAAVNSAATFTSAAMPLTFIISPAIATAPFTCLGAMPLGCL
jgi:hypothetical protein